MSTINHTLELAAIAALAFTVSMLYIIKRDM